MRPTAATSLACIKTQPGSRPCVTRQTALLTVTARTEAFVFPLGAWAEGVITWPVRGGQLLGHFNSVAHSLQPEKAPRENSQCVQESKPQPRGALQDGYRAWRGRGRGCQAPHAMAVLGQKPCYPNHPGCPSCSEHTLASYNSHTGATQIGAHKQDLDGTMVARNNSGSKHFCNLFLYTVGAKITGQTLFQDDQPVVTQGERNGLKKTNGL